MAIWGKRWYYVFNWKECVVSALVRNIVRNPLFVVVLYAVFGFIWIKYSDLFLETLVTDTARLTQLQTYKGWLFIGVTSSLLYLLVWNNIKANIRHEQYRLNFMMSTPLPLIVVHDSGNILFMNEAFTNTYGYLKEDISTVDIWMQKAYPDEEYRKRVAEDWQKSIEQGFDSDHPKGAFFTVCDKGGEKHEVQFFLIVQENSYIILCVDITKENELEMRLRQSEKMTAVGQLAGGIAHDFNNQLGVIQGYSEIISMGSDISAENREALKAIVQAVDHSKDLTNQLLLFSRREKRELVDLDINEVVTEVQGMIIHTFPKSVITSVELAAVPLVCKGARSLLVNAVLNLAINARDALGNRGNITLTTRRENRFAVITVEDDGGGIPESVLPHIFEPFYTTKEEGAGTGMGLATVYGTVELHGGEISVESSPDTGTQFTITIPLVG